LVKLYLKQNNKTKVLEKFQQFMEYGKGSVTNNVMEKGLNTLLDLVGSSNDIDLSEKLYKVASDFLLKQKNERVWFRTNLKLAKVLYDREEYSKLEKTLAELHRSCVDEKTGQDDPKKGSQLIDVYALEIQMYTAIKNIKKQKELYHKALSIPSAIPHPRIMGIIRECGGKANMREKDWEKARTDFFEAFKNYDEAGSPRRLSCLKYLILAFILSASEISPFDSPEVKPYKNEAEIVVMSNLVSAYEKMENKKFEDLLKHKSIQEDPFIRDYVPELLTMIQTKVLLRLLQAYSSLRIQYIATELNISEKNVEELAVTLILDEKIRGKIDQVNKVLQVESAKGSLHSKYRAVDKWASQLNTLQSTLFSRLQ